MIPKKMTWGRRRGGAKDFYIRSRYIVPFLYFDTTNSKTETNLNLQLRLIYEKFDLYRGYEAPNCIICYGIIRRRKILSGQSLVSVAFSPWSVHIDPISTTSTAITWCKASNRHDRWSFFVQPNKKVESQDSSCRITCRIMMLNDNSTSRSQSGKRKRKTTAHIIRTHCNIYTSVIKTP